MSTTWDWSPVFGPQGAISNYLQNMQYQKQLQAMMGQQNDVPTPGMQANVQLPSTKMPGADMFAPSQNGGKLAPSAYSHGSFSPPGMPQGASVQGGPISVGGGNIDVSTPSVGTHTEFTGPVGQALGNDQASALMPFLQALGPRGLPMLMQTTQSALQHKQDLADQQQQWQNEPVTLSPGQHRFINGKDVASVPEETPTVLTPAEAAQKNLPALPQGSFYKFSPKTGVSIERGDPNLLSPEAQKQRVAIAGAEATARQSAADASEVPYDQATLQNDVNIYLSTGGQVKPTFGMGKVGQKNNTVFRQGVAKTMRDANITAQDFATGRAGQKADTASLTNLQKQSDNTDSFIKMMDKNIGLVDSVLQRGGANGAPIINKYTQWLRGNVAADQDVKDLDAALTAVASEAAKVRSGSMGNTATNETLQNEARRQLNDAMSKGQITSMMHDILEKEGLNRKQSYVEQINQIRGRIGGGINTNSDAPTPVPGATPPPNPTQSKVINGVTYHKVGDKWMQE